MRKPPHEPPQIGPGEMLREPPAVPHGDGNFGGNGGRRSRQRRSSILTSRVEGIPGPPAIEPTEDGIALAFALENSDRYVFDHTHGHWLCWRGHRWQPDTTKYVPDCVRAFVRRVRGGLPAPNIALSLEKTWRAVERAARDDRIFARDNTAFDRDNDLLGTPEGTIELAGPRAGRLRPGEPHDLITRATAVAPSDTVDCPLWLQFIAEATGNDPELAAFLQRFCGYALTGDTREHALLFIHGLGATGKTVFLNTVAGIMGDYSVPASMETFVSTRSDRHPTDLALLAGARLVSASETQEDRAWDEARIKQLTGGDPITARFMRRDFFTYRPAFKLVIVGNFQPVLRNVDDAMRRRFCIVPFLHKPAKPDPQLEVKLRAEWPGILRWMIEGCVEWRANGLMRPGQVERETADYFDAQDTFRQWLDDECDAEPGNQWKSEASAALYASWRAYAIEAGDVPGSRKSFASNLKRRGFEPYRNKHERGFKGLRLMPSPAQPVTGDA